MVTERVLNQRPARTSREPLLFPGFRQDEEPVRLNGTGALSNRIQQQQQGGPAVRVADLGGSVLLHRLQQKHQEQVERGFYTLVDSAGPSQVQPEEQAAAPGFRVILVDLSQIAPNPYLPPVAPETEAIDRLAAAMRVHQVLEPLQLMPAPQEMRTEERYWVLSGELRRQAAIQAGLKEVPAMVQQVSLRAGLQLFLVQAMHAYEVLPLDFARVFQTLTAEMGMAPAQIASGVGASLADVEAELAFLGLEEHIRQSLEDKRLSRAHARILLEAPGRAVRGELWKYTLRYRPSPARLREKLRQLTEVADG